MEQQFGSDGFEILNMPDGQPITTERFSEFQRSWEYYRQAKAFEDELEDALSATEKPLVLTEGETDPEYITTALKLLGHQDLLGRLDIEWVGTQGPSSPVNTGKTGLDQTKKVIESNPRFIPHRTMLLYDWDTNKPREDIGLLSVRAIPRNENNTTFQSGIENLLPAELFQSPYRERFYKLRTRTTKSGETVSSEQFQKTAFCNWVCKERREPQDFAGFSVVVELLEEFLKLTPTP